MARPRKPPDPDRYDPCPRCELEYEPVARWPDGPICGYCYQQAKRTRGTCVTCGHEGVLPGRTPNGPTCRGCSGITINVDCVRCGAEDELYSGGLCWRCTLSDYVDHALRGHDGTIPAPLVPLADALRGMPRANSGLTWIKQKHVYAVLHQLAIAELELSHDALDRLPKSNTVTYIRELLVEHQVLPRRDRYVAGYEQWLAAKLAAIADDEHRKVIQRFGTWHHLRRLRARSAASPVTLSAFMNAKQSTTVAINFLDWLGGRGVELAEVSQVDIDRWHATGPSTSGRVDTFLFWARSHSVIGKIDIPRHHRDNGPSIGEQARIEAIRRVLTSDTMPLPIRVAAGLVLLYGQPVHRIAATRVDQVTITGEQVTIRFGRDDLTVPEPFAILVQMLVEARPNLQTAAHRDSPWLFPGYTPGQHLNANHLADKLSEHGTPPLAGRTGTWRQLLHRVAPSVLADDLGISAVTAMKHAQLAGSDYLRYAGGRSRTSVSPE